MNPEHYCSKKLNRMIAWSREGFSRDGKHCSIASINNILKIISKESGFKFEPRFKLIDDENSNTSISSNDSNETRDSSHNENIEDKTLDMNDETNEDTSNSSTDEENADDFSRETGRAKLSSKRSLSAETITKHPANNRGQKSIKNRYISKYNDFDGNKNRKGSNLYRNFETDTTMCTVCRRRFSNRSNMRRHYKCIHESMEFKCDTCKQSFARSDNLQAHNRICKSRKRIYPEAYNFEKFKTKQGKIDDNNTGTTITHARAYRI
jgi:hypothetical protein